MDTMAEAATAIGITGVVGVLQSLLECYKVFLTARDFGDDYAILQLRAALLENSITTWAIAVGLIDESGVPCNKFLVARPTEHNAMLVEATLALIRKQLDVGTTSWQRTRAMSQLLRIFRLCKSLPLSL
jgi:hypothetical protein